jgi:hypothetical protein
MDIETAIEKRKKYNPDVIDMYSRKSFGLDPGFGCLGLYFGKARLLFY